MNIKKDLTADAHQRMRARLEEAGCSPEQLDEKALAVKRSLDRNLNAERYIAHRNYVPDERPWRNALGGCYDRPIANVSVSASRNESAMELLRSLGYLVNVSAQNRDARQTTAAEEREFDAVLDDYAERVPNGSESWHAIRGGADDRPVFDMGAFGEPEEELPIEELSDEDAYERIVKERAAAYANDLAIDLGEYE